MTDQPNPRPMPYQPVSTDQPDRLAPYQTVSTAQPDRRIADDVHVDDVMREHGRAVDDGLSDYARRTHATRHGLDDDPGEGAQDEDDSERDPTLDGLRGFVHASVDTALDVAESVFKFAGAMLGTLTSASREAPSSRSSGSAVSSAGDDRRHGPGPSLLEISPGSPGTSVTGRMEVVNSTRDYMDAISPKCDVLVGTGGRSIAGHCISFVPRITDVRPNDAQEFTVTVQIPDAAKRGSYSGLITVTGHPAVRLLVHLDVN